MPPIHHRRTAIIEARKDPVTPSDVQFTAPVPCELAAVLSPGAVAFVASLTRRFSTTRHALLQRRVTIQAKLRAGAIPGLLPETASVRSDSWRVAPIPEDLRVRHVEITGPAADAKMVINALNSGANVFMADFEDALAPTWNNVLLGQHNLAAAIRGTLTYAAPGGKQYSLNPSRAVLMARPRGLHLIEKHMLVDGRPVPAGFFDFGLYLYNNANELLNRGTGPYFYLPKLENHREARLWNEIFTFAETELRIPHGSIKATVLIETILAAFEMEEILFEIRDHSAGLNCGRWDYIFSVIKKFRDHPSYVLPDRSKLTMDLPFLDAYARLLVDACHRHGAQAIGGMAAYIPVKENEAQNAEAFRKVRLDKEREVRLGHDGTWVAHPGLVSTALEPFASRNGHRPERPDTNALRANLLRIPEGFVTEHGIRTNIRVTVEYLASWLGGQGAVPIAHLMEDMATAEISRSQLWQWIRHSARMDDGRSVTTDLIRKLIDEESATLSRKPGAEPLARQIESARSILTQMLNQHSYDEFMTIPAYSHIP